MSKKIMKRSLALGALMAFVITGSAWADVIVTINDECLKSDILDLSIDKTVDSFVYAYKNNDSVVAGVVVNDDGGKITGNIDSLNSNLKVDEVFEKVDEELGE